MFLSSSRVGGCKHRVKEELLLTEKQKEKQKEKRKEKEVLL